MSKVKRTSNRGRPMRPANLLELAARKLDLRPGDREQLRQMARRMRGWQLHTADLVCRALDNDL